jgi:streptomycin 6-kinase
LDGRGAVRLLAQDRERGALLIERCEPGTSLRTVADADEALATEADLLERMWRRPPAGHTFGLLGDDVTRWAGAFPGVWEQLGRPFERGLVDAAVSAARELAPTQGDEVLLHQDFHSANVLRAEREAWLAIDPQPLVGERELDAASLLRDRRHELFREPDPWAQLHRRLDWLTERLGLDRERTRAWGVVHALAWGVSAVGKVEADMVECARLLLGE